VSTPRAAFYCVADSRYFLGAVGMLNSLRLLGHTEPVYVLDCGLAPRQRELLAPHVTIVEAPGHSPPWLLKTVAPLRHPAEVMVLIDADIVVTRSLAGLIERARQPCAIAVTDNVDRFVGEWGELLGLGELRRQPYLSSGLVVLGNPVGGQVLSAMAELQDRVDFDRTYWRANDPEYPFLYGDQDVFNAILASRIEPEHVVALANRLAANPPFTGLRVIDEATLRCAYEDGTEPYVVHHHTAKPWLERTHDGAYSRLLRRLLDGPDVTVEVPKRQVPLRLRRGLVPYVERKRIDVGQRLRWRFS
jgi:hypothetical protein